MTIKHHVVRVEIGPNPVMANDCRLILEDGSEVVGLTRVEAECRYMQIPKFRVEGEIYASLGLEGEPARVPFAPGTEDQP